MAEPTHAANTYPILPLRIGVLFPSQIMPISVQRPDSTAAMEAALASEEKTLVIMTQLDREKENPDFDDLYTVGTLAVIKRMQRVDGTIQAIVQGGTRVRIDQKTSREPYMRAEFVLLPEPSDTSAEVEALFGETVKLSNRAFQLLQPEAPATLSELARNVNRPIQYVYLLASTFSLGIEKEQAVLEATTQLDALRIMHEFLTHEVQVLELRHQIASQAETEMSRQQREYFLRQQLQAIQKELGESEPGEAEVAELRRRVAESDLPENVAKEIEKEISRMERMSPAAADYQVIRTYIDLALEMPWKKTTEDVLDLRHAREVLDEDHFDLNDVKDRIIEHLAVMKMNPKAKAPILCFVGPPGVGKTSLGQSIGRAIGRKFERMSLGGLHDEAELRGHRRTYVGAMPGRIIQAIRRAGVRNPILMLDEVDKLGRDFRGDPASALMEVLDPAQNAEFHDNYLDMPFDLSSVFFITTANTLETIPRPLLDRMEVLQLVGYSEEDKLQIARRYLVRRQLAQAGLTDEQLEITEGALNAIINRYTREAGVRELERMIGRIARKVATRFADQSAASSSESSAEPSAISLQLGNITVTQDDLTDLLGPERFFREKALQTTRPGVAAGLAWTEAGGEVLYIETVLLPQGRGLILTGQLGRVMRESARAARSFVRSRAKELGLDLKKFRRAGVHIHVPAGAVPKDGPSAGVAIVTALASLYSDLPVRNDTAMTGEITLSGQVLPVGGIREKVLAARRAGLRHVVLPRQNESDLKELPKDVQHDMEFILVDRIEQALNAAIPQLSDRLSFAEPQTV
ncbi:MAG TPA: endopeptidase La [Lacipirellulaceae bacterium]|nr:endopeptidase La [Lacipirellulaceae bacterium]